ncbi:MAG: dolichyl-phosphate beta-glucosyltransferase [Chloroflexota bacterium]
MSTARQPLLSIVIPAYNEERRLPGTLAAIHAFVTDTQLAVEVLVADDGSRDGTAAVVNAYAQTWPALRLLALDHRGKGFAVRAGALASQGRYVLLCDADLAVPIAEWQRMLPLLESGYDVVIGSREGQGARREGEPVHRHIMGRVFNTLVRSIVVGNFHDTQCGFKAFRTAVAHDLFHRAQIYGADAPVIEGAAVTAFDVEILYLAVARGYRVAELPVLWHYGEETKVDPIRDAMRNLRDIMRVRWLALRGEYRHLDDPRV